MSDYVLVQEGYESLAEAVVKRAALDYRKAWRKYRKGDESAMQEILRIESFFKSDYGDSLANGIAKKILRRLQKEQEEKPKRTAKITKREIDK